MFFVYNFSTEYLIERFFICTRSGVYIISWGYPNPKQTFEVLSKVDPVDLLQLAQLIISSSWQGLYIVRIPMTTRIYSRSLN